MTDLPAAHHLLQSASAENLPVGQQRFIRQLSNLYNCLYEASLKEDTALALFKTPARQSAFYLQALSRIYRKLHNEKLFETLRSEFKSLEDQLGKIDFFNAYLNEFSQDENFPSPLLKYFRSKMEAEVVALQQLLDEKKWIKNNFEMVQQLISELTKMNWLDTEEDRKAVAIFLEDDLDDFDDDYEDGKFDFNLIEDGVHEFRRELRWFSIYAQALDGLIQLEDTDKTDLKKYLTPEILNSPFNKLPAPKNDIESIYIQASNFYALSWVVNEMGILKDDGLRIHALTQAIVETGMKTRTDAETYAASFAKNKHSISDVSKLAKEIADEFIKKNGVIKQMEKDVEKVINHE